MGSKQCAEAGNLVIGASPLYLAEHHHYLASMHRDKFALPCLSEEPPCALEWASCRWTLRLNPYCDRTVGGTIVPPDLAGERLLRHRIGSGITQQVEQEIPAEAALRFNGNSPADHLHCKNPTSSLDGRHQDILLIDSVNSWNPQVSKCL